MANVSPRWESTHIHGLEVRRTATGAVAMRLLGWEEVLPLSLIRFTVPAATAALPQDGDRGRHALG
ncbi:hypothetical protein [Streptomyces sp. NPDC055140]